MIEHALIIVRGWMNELGENNPYEQAFNDIRSHYRDLFADWLTSEDPTREETLNQLTGDTYRLVDAVYISLRMARGLSPVMHGFNKDSAQSIMRYFSSCVQLSEDDLVWLRNSFNDSESASLALMAISALSKNLRECFSEPAMMVLIEGINGTNEVVAEQCLANVILLLAHYDVRIDFFPELQNAFLEAVDVESTDETKAFDTLCALIRSVKMSWINQIQSGEITYEDLPEELQNLLKMSGTKADDMNGIVSWVPRSENDYLAGIVQILPDTWIYSALIADIPERLNTVAMLYLSIGKMDLVWDNLNSAEQWLLHRLRGGKAEAVDYINYGHCLLLRGDRMMAFESYREARQMCKSAKDFYALFRPDRRQLVDRGIPVEQVYFIEDQLFTI